MGKFKLIFCRLIKKSGDSDERGVAAANVFVGMIM